MSLISVSSASAEILTDLQVFALSAVSVVSKRQFRHADDAVHRRADFMAHVREKLSLGGGRFLGDMLGHLEFAHELRQAFGVVLLFASGRLHLLAVPFQRVLGAFAFSDVAGIRVDRSKLGEGDGIPEKPFIRAVTGAVPVLEVAHGGAGLQRRHDGDRGFAIIGMDEIEERAGHQLLARVPERALPGRIHAREIPVERRDALEIERDSEEPVELFFGSFAGDEQANLAADGGQHTKQIRVRRTYFAREELHDG